MFKVHLGDTPNDLTPADFDELGRRTQGFSGSDVNVVVKDVLMEPVRKTQEATHFRQASLLFKFDCAMEEEPSKRRPCRTHLQFTLGTAALV